MPLTESDAAQLFREEPDRFLDVGAGEVAHRKVGTGPDVLFVHGWPVERRTWRKLLPHLVDHVTCHVIDFPSAGSSRFDADTPMSIDQHITGPSAGSSTCSGWSEVAVVGHDSGGMIARHAMAGDPRLARDGPDQHRTPRPSWRFRSFIAARRLAGTQRRAGLGRGPTQVRAPNSSSVMRSRPLTARRRVRRVLLRPTPQQSHRPRRSGPAAAKLRHEPRNRPPGDPPSTQGAGQTRLG